MAWSTVIRLQAGAAPARVFDVFERSLLAQASHGEVEDAGSGDGLTRCQVHARQRPTHLAWTLHQRHQALRFDLQLHPAPPAHTEGECRVEVTARRLGRRALVGLLGSVLQRSLRRRLNMLARLAESSDDGRAPTPPSASGTAWRRAQHQYRGLLEACAPGLHDAAAELVLARVAAARRPLVPVLDLGSGSGAFLARLRDAGFVSLQAVELDTQGFGLEDVPVQGLNLNEAFASRFEPRRFGLVSALEIVEHLDSPRAFLRQVHALLAEDGHALVSMPNIAHWAGRLKFLLRGEHRYFEEGDYAQRHISPMTDLHMRLMFGELGFQVLADTTAGSFDGPLRRALLAPISGAFRLWAGPRSDGDVAVYLLHKSAPDRVRLGSDPDYRRRGTRPWATPPGTHP